MSIDPGDDDEDDRGDPSSEGRGRRFGAASGAWTLCRYLGLGAVPMALAAGGGAR